MKSNLETKPEEVLQKLFYVDLIFSRLDKKPSSIHEFQLIIQDLKNKVINKSINEISDKLSEKDLIWFYRLLNKKCKIINLDLSRFCIDDYHDGIYIGGIKVQRGDKIKYICDYIKKDDRIQSLFKCSFFEELISEIPIVVRPYQNMYEIILGNHRAIVALKKGKKEVKCICFCESNNSNLCNTLNFK